MSEWAFWYLQWTISNRLASRWDKSPKVYVGWIIKLLFPCCMLRSINHSQAQFHCHYLSQQWAIKLMHWNPMQLFMSYNLILIHSQTSLSLRCVVVSKCLQGFAALLYVWACGFGIPVHSCLTTYFAACSWINIPVNTRLRKAHHTDSSKEY